MTTIIQFKIKMPCDVKRWIEEQAAQNLRSQSNEIILAIRDKMVHMERKDS